MGGACEADCHPRGDLPESSAPSVIGRTGRARVHRIVQANSGPAFRIDRSDCDHFLSGRLCDRSRHVINPGRGKPRQDMTIVVHEDAIVAVLPWNNSDQALP